MIDWEDEWAARREQELRREEKWDSELMERKLKEQSRISAWEAEWKARREDECLQEEKWHREEEERQWLGLYWGNLEADQHCTAYETRYYSAHLLNTVPYTGGNDQCLVTKHCTKHSGPR